MSKKSKPQKKTEVEAVALLQYLLCEAYEAGKDMHYRLRVPYKGKYGAVEFVVEFAIYYDKEMETTQDGKQLKVKIAGPRKQRH